MAELDFTKVDPDSHVPSNFNYRERTVMFAEAMAREMRANDHKGPGLPTLDYSKLVVEIDNHVRKLKEVSQAITVDLLNGTEPSDWLKNRALEFAADVGNCAMFFAHSFGTLTPERIAARRDEPNFMENSYEGRD